MKHPLLFALSSGLAVASLTIEASEQLAKTKNCLACHGIENKVVGPAYKEVAKKYEGQADAVGKLAEKVIKGGGGVWGQVPMPPNSQVSVDEAKQLVQWILSLR